MPDQSTPTPPDCKTCTNCCQSKLAVEFHWRHGEGSGRRPLCIPCDRERMRKKWHERMTNNPELREPRRARSRELKRLARLRDPEGHREKERLRDKRAKFGLTAERLREMEAAQGGVCAICGNPETAKLNGTVKRLAVDHDHITGTVRALLCTMCNTGLGCFRADKQGEELLAKAIAYINKFRRPG